MTMFLYLVSQGKVREKQCGKDGGRACQYVTNNIVAILEVEGCSGELYVCTMMCVEFEVR